jgi:peptide/nickel transport system permease protein
MNTDNPNNTTPDNTTPDKSNPDNTTPDKSILGESILGESVPGRSVPGGKGVWGRGGLGVLGRWAGTLRTPLGGSAAVLLGVLLVMAVLGPVLWSGRADATNTDALSQGSSGAHWLGTDNLGRDLFFRVLVGTRLSVELALVATLIGVVTGVLLGSLPWLLGRRGGRFATAVVNIAVAFPGLLLALFFAVIFGAGAKGAVLAIGLATAPWYARVTNTLVAGIQEREFIAAARIAGISRPRILVRHILPNIGEPLIVNAAIGAGGALLGLAGLSFLGLGVQAPDYDWGLLLNQGLDGIYERPAGALAPGVAIVIAGLAFNLLGETAAKQVGMRTTAVRSAKTTTKTTHTTHTTHATDTTDAADAAGVGPVLVVQDLTVSVAGPTGPMTPVRRISFSIGAGEAVGVVGESGSGKSLTALAAAQLLEPPARIDAARLEFLGTDLLGPASKTVRRQLLGTGFGMVFQDPTTSFNPTIHIGSQLAELARHHQHLDRKKARARAIDRLRAARIPAPERRAGQYPHEFSGGMRQRAMIAMAMMGEPALIVADEPTTALDVTVQHQILRLLDGIRTTSGVAILLISHDITVITQVCDRVLVMYAGRIVEELPSRHLATHARHPYTRALLAAVPDMTADRNQPLAIIPGPVIDPANLPTGCAFTPRCPHATTQCHQQDPPLTTTNSDTSGETIAQRIACWHPQNPDQNPDQSPEQLSSGERPATEPTDTPSR